MTRLVVRPPVTPTSAFAAAGFERETEIELRRGMAVHRMRLSPRMKWSGAALLIAGTAGPLSYAYFGGTGLGVFLFSWFTFSALAIGGDAPGRVSHAGWRTRRRVVLDLLDGEVREERGARTTLRIPLDERARVKVSGSAGRSAHLVRDDASLDIASWAADDDEAVLRVSAVLEEMGRFGVRVPPRDALIPPGRSATRRRE